MSSSDEEDGVHQASSQCSSSSGDECETAAVNDTCNQKPRQSARVDYAKELEEDENVGKKLECTILDPETQKNCDQLVNFLEVVFKKLVNIFYEDITPSLSNGTPFLVDGDMLLIHAMADANYSKSLGGQMLHLVYLCERRLQYFVKKDGIFQIAFFYKWLEVWQDFPDIQLARTVLINHFKHNMKYSVYEFNSIWDLKFKQHLDTCRPPFVLMDLDIDHYPESLSVKLLFFAHILLAISSSVLCIDLNGLKLDVSTLIAFNATPKFSLKNMLHRNSKKLVQCIDSFLESLNEPTVSIVNELEPRLVVRFENFITVSTAASMLVEQNVSHDLIRVFLVYSAVKRLLPLSSRGFCKLQPVPEELHSFVCLLQKKINTALHKAGGLGLDMTYVADVWQGNLFSVTVNMLSTCDTTETSNIWSSAVGCAYRELSVETCQQANISLAAFPVFGENVDWFDRLESFDNSIEAGMEQEECREVFPVSCTVVEEFCHDSVLQPVHFTKKEVAVIMDYQKKNSEFDEIRHFHSRRPLTDEVERTKDSWNSQKSDNSWEQKKIDRSNQNFVRFLEKYGMNMEGNLLNPKPIVCIQNQKSSGKQKEGKVSKKAQKIINDKKEADDKKRDALDKEHIKSFSQQFKNMMVASKYSQALDKIDELLKRLKLPQTKCMILIYKAEVYHKMWVEVCNAGNKQDLTYAKNLFLTIKAILQHVRKEKIKLSDNDNKNIAGWLVELGCEEVALKCGLMLPSRARTDLTTGMSWVEFQLEHLGPELDRVSSGVPDKRVEGFVPDEWQTKLFDIVDKRQSALVVAPTSSGKTYASYYCMESVLRESNDGVVVYVSPTKALVSQVHATVYARFKNKKMPAGKAVCGVFTRDYRFKAMECQILVTVPQCLELLLLSARRHDWTLKLRYVILDEIHCLAGQAGGIAWERCLLMIRCPFLALSATVGQPDSFHKWLQRVEDFKAKRDVVDNISRVKESYRVKLVQHADRHADLVKYVYLGGAFRHVHPFAFIDERISERGIPKHMTLSPSETLQLYKTMSSIESNLEIPKPDIYFSASDTGFLTRSAVKDYEQLLRANLEIWAREDNEKYQLVGENLRNELDIPKESAAKEEVGEECTALAMALKQNKMLPALVFSYSRDLIEVASLSLTEGCKKLVITKVTQKQTKFEGREQRKAMEKLDSIPKDFKIKTLELLEGQGYFRNVGTVDNRDLEFLEKRLLREGLKSNSEFVECLRQGVGYHHGGLSRTKKSAVEMMFRLNVLNLVYATGTLALGIHMPCRTVVLAGDSHFINSMEYHQMSGRAGRRGYDISGNVVFMGVGQRKIKTLINDDFPMMKGNFPLSVGAVLRVLLLVTRVTSKGAQSPAITKDALSRVLTLLNCSMVYEECPEMKQQMKYFFSFSTLLLMLQGFIDEHGSPQMLSSIVTHLHYHEPGNLAFVFLFRTGALRQLCVVERNGAISKETQLNLVLVLSYLFARMPLHKSLIKRQLRNSVVKLPPLPTFIREILKEYNEQVKFVFNKFFQSVSKHCEKTMGPDNKLPLSGIEFSPPVAVSEVQENTLECKLMSRSGARMICSAFAALSGNDDTYLYSETGLVSNIRHQVFTDMKVVPVIDLDETLNGYAWDFYNHGIVSAIRNDNKLKTGTDFEKIKDFHLVLKAINATLEDLEPCDLNDPVARTVRTVTDTLSHLIRNGFGGGG